MDHNDFKEIMSLMDIVEVSIRAEKAREFLHDGNTEDALAYAMASGFRMGWNAYKKKLEKGD